jgi:hypothetical protein
LMMVMTKTFVEQAAPQPKLLSGDLRVQIK